jgi:hypothetical protein
MTEGGGIVCKAPPTPTEGAEMTEPDEREGGIELLLHEPEIVAWLDDYRRTAGDDDEGGEPPRAA